MRNAILNHILDLLYPRKCVFCGKVIEKREVCNDCAAILPLTKGDAVSQKLPFISACVSPLFYDDIVRDSFLRYKFKGIQAYATYYGRIMAKCAENNLDCNTIDVISCVPLSKKRERKRGYNQSRLISEEISDRLGIPEKELLKKVKDTPAQSLTKSTKERLTNVSGVYSMQNGAAVDGKTILLVDDIVTTGATLSECARILRKAGAKQVYAVTLARHRD